MIPSCLYISSSSGVAFELFCSKSPTREGRAVPLAYTHSKNHLSPQKPASKQKSERATHHLFLDHRIQAVLRPEEPRLRALREPLEARAGEPVRHVLHWSPSVRYYYW